MSVDIQLERLYDRIQLVRGPGKPRDGRLCIMSLVAYLAGESHGDRPSTASPVIRNFAIQLNDGVKAEWRQELKPFAPRIIGTNDGHEWMRGEALVQAVVDEILPRASAQFGFSEGEIYDRVLDPFMTPYPPQAVVSGHEALGALLCQVKLAYSRKDYLMLATWAGNLLVVLSRCAHGVSEKRWYWAKALELLDRLCDIGGEQRVPAISMARLQQAQPIPATGKGGRASLQSLVNELGRVKGVCKSMLQHVM
ncbi:MAG TPA: hypothetical protein VKY65_06740 [Alphaproteobacteria bacterium]|nr:hypothetical protein [Alphaproteobacteria bacterium]